MALQKPIETERLLLREFTLDDAEAFYQMCSDSQVTRFTGGPGIKSLDEASAELLARPIADYQKHGYGRWACVLKESGLVIGFAGLKFLDDLQEVDIGYRFLSAYWGKGLATEAGRPIMRYGFDVLKLERIIGLVDPANVASVRVPEKLGLTYVAMIEYRGQPAAKYVIPV
jgi:RimJ/RimL family protein N-acetyltransferase